MSSLRLPLEVIFYVLDFVDEIKELAECRLICKACNPKATKLMLGKPICIANEEQAWGFIKHLTKDTKLKSYVRHLRITSRTHYDMDYLRNENSLSDDEGNPYKRILSLVFQENLEIIDGNLDDPYSYQLLCNMARQSRDQQKIKLRKIPDPGEETSDVYKEAVLCFTESLEHLYLLIPRQISSTGIRLFLSLKNFTCLTSIALSVERNNIVSLKFIADNCPRLQELNIKWIGNEGDWTTDQVRQWFEGHDTHSACSLKVLNVSNCSSCNPIEYLVLKYLRIENISIDISSYNDHIEAAVVLLRIIRALKDNATGYNITFLPNRLFTELYNAVFHVLAFENSINVSTSSDNDDLLTITVTPLHQG
ncbi:hypothetical protein BD408DRAFT_433227 [Parasitella parasitica]|nr:hypothetical protein BD408DRAFT_433227 [Parasitella parasitica]